MTDEERRGARDVSGDEESRGDAVSAAFAAMRRQAVRSGRAPRLGTAGPTPRRALAGRGVRIPGIVESPAPAAERRRRGRPTGKDGRALPRSRDVASVASILGREIRRRGWAAELASGWVTTHWDRLVGQRIAEHAAVEMLKDTTLFISCDSTAWATNLRLMQAKILEAIAAEVGDGLVTELKIFGPRAPSWRKGPLHVRGRGPRDTYG